jgi:hypothetical protein
MTTLGLQQTYLCSFVGSAGAKRKQPTPPLTPPPPFTHSTHLCRAAHGEGAVAHGQAVEPGTGHIRDARVHIHRKPVAARGRGRRRHSKGTGGGPCDG